MEWSASYPSRVFATATKRFLFYEHLGMGSYNDMEDEYEEGDEEEESPGFNMMVLPNAELCGLWLVTLLLLFTFEYGILHQGVPDLRGGLEGEPVEEHRGQPRVRSPPGRPSAGERKWTTKQQLGVIHCTVLRWAPPGWAWSMAPLALERLLSAVHSPTRSPKYGTLLLFLRGTILQVAIQLTGEPGTFTQGILVDVNSQSLSSKVLNLFVLLLCM